MSNNDIEEYYLFCFRWSLEDDLDYFIDETQDIDERPEYYIRAYKLSRRLNEADNTANCKVIESLELFESLEEAKMKLSIEGWDLKDATQQFRKFKYLGREVAKAFTLSR